MTPTFFVPGQYDFIDTFGASQPRNINKLLSNNYQLIRQNEAPEIHNTMLQTIELFSSNHSKTGEEMCQTNKLTTISSSEPFVPLGCHGIHGRSTPSFEERRPEKCKQRDGGGT